MTVGAVADLAGAVLCGGASRRMGQDKAFVEWDGVPMARRMADTLSAAGCRPVLAIGGDGLRLAALGLQVVPDDRPGEGPLAGVLTALDAAGGRGVVVVACDMPQLRPGAVASVAAALVGDAQVALAVATRREPLCAAWAPSAGPVLAAAFAAGVRALHAVLETLRVAEVSISSQDVRNVNAPSDLAH